jgi:hypothetical protein
MGKYYNQGGFTKQLKYKRVWVNMQNLVEKSLSTKISEYFEIEKKRNKIIKNNNLLKYQKIEFNSRDCEMLIAKKELAKRGKGYCYKKLLDDKVPSDKPGVYIFEIESSKQIQVLKSFEEWVKAVNNDKENKIKHVKLNKNGASKIPNLFLSTCQNYRKKSLPHGKKS